VLACQVGARLATALRAGVFAQGDAERALEESMKMRGAQMYGRRQLLQ
jgi:hypothetical protein